jgi:glycosyltransferase involved in cell wall biosynthesis
VKNDLRVLDCVDVILAQEADFAYDVVIVDNGSTDETPQRMADAYGDLDDVHLLSTPGNLSKAWNEAARSSSAPVLVRIDADAEPCEGWLAAIAEPLLADRADWAAGPVEGVHAEGLVARYFHHRTEAYGRRMEGEDELREAVPSWNVAYQRQALEAAGWYDPWQASSVDWDLHKRLARTGAVGTYVPEARARHHHPETLSAFARKEAWYKTGQYQMGLKYGFASVASAFVLPGAYLGALAVLAAGLFAPVAALGGLGLLALMAVVHAVGGIREDDPAWYLRPLFRPVEALAGIYGLGRGLVRYGLSSRAVPGAADGTV